MRACLVAKLCPTLCDCMDSSLPNSSVHEISQARKLECVAISFSREPFRPRYQSPAPVFYALAGKFFTTKSPGKPQAYMNTTHIKDIFTYG